MRRSPTFRSQDQKDRPIAGHINFCPEKILPDGNYDNQLKTALHELMHVLAMSRSLFA